MGVDGDTDTAGLKGGGKSMGKEKMDGQMEGEMS